MICECVAHRARRRLFHALTRARRPELRRDRECATTAGDDGRIAEQRRHARAIDRGGHHEQPQVGAEQRLRLQRQREARVSVYGPFVKFVEADHADTVQRGIVEQHPGQHPFGDHLDARGGTHAGIAAHAPAHALAYAIAPQVRHATGGRPGGKAARFEQQNALCAEPWSHEQRQRDARGLAGTRGSDEHGRRTDLQRVEQCRHDCHHGQQFGAGRQGRN